MIINTTPYEISIYGEAKEFVISLPPAEMPARLAVTTEYYDAVDGVPLYKTVYGDPENLPPRKEGTIYVVSLLLRDAVYWRSDLWSPGQLLRDESGLVVGCIGLTR